MLTRLRKDPRHGDQGFTLIELLVVIIIIGILAAIAIPVFLNQRQKGYDAAAKSDTRNMASAEESYLIGSPAYVDSAGSATLTTFRQSSGVTTNVKANGSTGYCVVSKSASGSYFVWDSKVGTLGGPLSAYPTSTTGFAAGGSCVTASPTSF